MKTILACIAIIAATSSASAQFLGGWAEGSAAAAERGLQERALDLDARDGGSRYYRLRQQQQLDSIERAIKRNTEALEEANTRRRIRGW